MTINNRGFGEFETVPALIPAAGEDIISSDAHVLEIHLINITSSPATVTIVDKQGSPVAVIPPDLSVAGNADAIWEFTGRYAPGGLHWEASDDNAIVGYVRWRNG